MPSSRPVLPQGYGMAPSTSAALPTQRDGFSVRDQAAWRQQSPYSWTCEQWTICAVRLRGATVYELWKNSAFVTRADDAETLRNVAAAGSDAP